MVMAALVMGCASTKQQSVVKPLTIQTGVMDETFDPQSLDDDDITFKEPVNPPEISDPVYLPVEKNSDNSNVILENKLVDGYRIQIHSTKDLENATRAKAMAMEQFTNMPVKFYLEFDSPYYKVRLGDFQSRNEADQIRSVVRSRGYPQAWIVKTRVWSNPVFPAAKDSTILNSPD